MNHYKPCKAYVSIGLAIISIGAVMFKCTSPETETEAKAKAEPIPRQTDFQSRPTLRPLEVVDPEDTPYTKEELEEIFR